MAYICTIYFLSYLPLLFPTVFKLPCVFKLHGIFLQATEYKVLSTYVQMWSPLLKLPVSAHAPKGKSDSSFPHSINQLIDNGS